MNTTRPRILRTVRRPEAFILLAVLVLILLASMVVVSLMFRLQAQKTASQASQVSEQAYQTAFSGIQVALGLATRIKPGTTDWRDLPQQLKHQLVADDGSDQWFFTVYSAPDEESNGELRFGLTDEASKLNINSAHTTNLTELSGLTLAQVAILRDFIDSDEMTRPEGAEQEVYNQKSPPYKVRNGALQTPGEMLLVQGFNHQLVYGEDANMNWRLDPNEDDGDTLPPSDNHDGRLQTGLIGVLTTYSSEPNVNLEGRPRIQIHRKGEALPPIPLPAAFTNFLHALHETQVVFSNITDLLDAHIKVKDAKGVEMEVGSGVNGENLALIDDHFTGTSARMFEGRVNVNTASARVLSAVSGISEPLADAILSARKSISPEKRGSIAWLLQEGVVDIPTFKSIAPYLTTRSFQFSFRVAGYSIPSGQFRVLDVVIDVSTPQEPRILFLRDLTRFGAPFPFQPQDSAPSNSQASTPSFQPYPHLALVSF